MQIHRAKEQDALRKPLKVKFVGEEGVDEGGVQKEFFQLLVSQRSMTCLGRGGMGGRGAKGGRCGRGQGAAGVLSTAGELGVCDTPWVRGQRGMRGGRCGRGWRAKGVFAVLGELGV